MSLRPPRSDSCPELDLTRTSFMQYQTCDPAKNNHSCKAETRWILTMFFLAALFSGQAQAQTFTVLYAFQGGPDGAQPWGGLVMDRAGNLYGITNTGGRYTNG